MLEREKGATKRCAILTQHFSYIIHIFEMEMSIFERSNLVFVADIAIEKWPSCMAERETLTSSQATKCLQRSDIESVNDLSLIATKSWNEELDLLDPGRMIDQAFPRFARLVDLLQIQTITAAKTMRMDIAMPITMFDR